MAVSKTTLTMLRSLALIGAIIIFGLGIWTLTIIQDMENRGDIVLMTFRSRLGVEAGSWSWFIATATRGIPRTCILIVTCSIFALAILLVITSNRVYWLRMLSTTVMLVELTAAICSIIVAGCALSLALDIRAFSTPPYTTLNSADLSHFALLDPLSRALALTSAVTGCFLSITCTANVVNMLTQRSKAKDVRSFEPTVSALGMSHGFQALNPQPRTACGAVPSIYDAHKSFQRGPGRPANIRQVTFANEGAWMSGKPSRWSASTASPSRIEGDIMRLLDVKRARRAIPVRPARSEEALTGSEGIPLRR